MINVNYFFVERIFLNFIIFTLPIAVIIGNFVINLYLILICIFYILRCILQKKIVNFESKEFKIFLFFYIYLILNSAFSQEAPSSLIRSVTYIKFFIFIIFIKFLFDKKYFNSIYLGFFWLIILTLLSLDIFYQNIFGVNILGHKSITASRNSGFFFDELIAGGFITAFSFISIMLVHKKINLKVIFFFLIFFLLAVFFSGERSNFIKYIIIFLSITTFYFRELIKKHKIAVFLITLILSLLIFNTKTFQTRYLTTVSYSSDKKLSIHDIYFRSQYGAHTLSSYYIFKDNFLLGVGNKNFRKECKKYEKKVINFQKKIEPYAKIYLNGCSTHPHQIYNEFLSEHGLLGTIIIIGLLFCLIIKNKILLISSKIRFVALIYILTVFLPIIPSGSFFTTTISVFFWINILFYLVIFEEKSINVS